MVAAQLEAADRALETGALATALVHLLEAWRASREPRIADVIDHVTAETNCTPIAGKTIADRARAWLELATTYDPIVAARLLATPIPKQTKAARAMTNAILQWPHDPRVSRVLARVIHDDHPREMAARINAHIVALSDRRALEELRLSVNGNWARIPLEEVVVPPLPADAEAPLQVLERRYAHTTEHSGDDLLAAIYANPTDDHAIAVYGDWLSERGDPRGEFIALQLSGTNPQRERGLIAKHLVAFAGPIGRYFTGHLFERGFLVGGHFGHGPQVEELLRHREIAMIHTLDVTRAFPKTVAQLIARPELAHLRAIGPVDDSIAHGIFKLTHLRTLQLTGPHAPSPKLATCDALPALETLSLDYPDLTDYLRTAPVIERVTTVGVSPKNLAALEALADRGGNLRTIELLSPATRLAHREGWHVRLQRSTAGGPFTHVTLHLRSTPTASTGAEAVELLSTIPAEWLTDIDVITPSKKKKLLPNEAIERFPKLIRRGVR
jgi:uncharacterized protein (TIGR02996 family)